MSRVVAVGADPSAAWAPAPAAVVVPVDAGAPAAVPAGCAHRVVAVPCDAGSIVAAVRAEDPDEVLVDAGALGELAALVLVPLREVGVRCAVRADGAPAAIEAMLDPAGDARGMRAVRVPAATAGAGAIPAPVDAVAASARAIARLEAEVDALAVRNGELEGALRGLAGAGATARAVVRTTSPRVGRAVMRAYRSGRSAAMLVGAWRPRA